jgi:type 1 glutamine amidotransferase
MNRCTLPLVLSLTLLSPLTGADTVDGGGAKIVLIGGKKSHGVGEHDFANGLAQIRRCLEGTTNVRNLKVEIHPDAWPADTASLAGARTVVWYFDGIQQVPHPLADPERLKAFSALMDQGVGLVCLHQAGSLPADNKTIPLTSWIGGTRFGMVDRAMGMTAFTQEHLEHPIGHGWTSFSAKDEVYPTIAFGEKMPLSLLSAVVPPEKPAPHATAWAFERANGGRGFAYTGGHFLVSWDVPAIRTMTLNAILWTAKLEVPAEGVQTSVPFAAPTAAPTKP